MDTLRDRENKLEIHTYILPCLFLETRFLRRLRPNPVKRPVKITIVMLSCMLPCVRIKVLQKLAKLTRLKIHYLGG